MGARTNIRTVRIEWGDCDPMGIVYFPRYFAILDDCTWHLFEQVVGMSKLRMREVYKIGGFPLVDARARFLIPSRYGDDVVIESRIAEFRRSSFDVVHRLTRAGELSVEGFETRVWSGADPADPSRLKSFPIPPEVKARFA